jgi:prophage regulatory protein
MAAGPFPFLTMKRQRQRLLKFPELTKESGFSAATIQRLRKAGRFPAPIRLSERRIAWPSEAILTWLESRTEGSDPR